MVDQKIMADARIEALRKAARAVIDGKERPGGRVLLGDGQEPDAMVPYHEVEDQALDALEAALAAYHQEAIVETREQE